MLKSVSNPGTLRLLFPACDVLRKMARDANEECDPSMFFARAFFQCVSITNLKISSRYFTENPSLFIQNLIQINWKHLWAEPNNSAYKIRSTWKVIQLNQTTLVQGPPFHHIPSNDCRLQGSGSHYLRMKTGSSKVFSKNLVKSLDYIIRKLENPGNLGGTAFFVTAGQMPIWSKVFFWLHLWQIHMPKL